MHLSNVDVFENKILLCWAVVCFFFKYLLSIFKMCYEYSKFCSLSEYRCVYSRSIMFTRLSAAQNNILKHLLLTGVVIDSDLWYLSERRLKPVCISPRIEVNLELSLFFFFSLIT